VNNSKTFRNSLPTLTAAFAALLGLAALAFAATPASAQAVNFGSLNVCPAGKTTPAPCSANQTVTFSIPAGTTITSIPILTTGAPGLDFKAKPDDTGATLCKAQKYSSATTCTVDVTFAPLAAGLRKGAVELLDGATVVALTYVYGIGVGPRIAFNPYPALIPLGAPSATENLSPLGIAVDASENFYISTLKVGAGPTVQEWLASDHYTTIKTLSEIDANRGIAVDGAGNVFCGSATSDQVIELVAARGYAAKEINGGDGLVHGVAVDGSGNLFVGLLSLTHKPGVLEFPQADGYTTFTTLGSGFNQIWGLTADGAGNVFVIDQIETSKADIKEIEAAGGYTTVKTLSDRFTTPTGLAVDAADNVYVFDAKVYELVAAGGYTERNVIGNGGLRGEDTNNSLAVDGGGNIFLAEATLTSAGAPATTIGELPRSQPPALDFDTTLVGSPSYDSPLSTTVQNIGNASLTFSNISLTDETDFSLVAGPATPAACADEIPLAASEECNLNVDFTPQSAETLTGSLVLTDNVDNATDATQSIALSGAGSTVGVTPAILNFGSIPYPGTATQPLTITNGGAGTLTVAASSNGRGAVITGNTCGSGVAAGKTCTLQVQFKPVQLGPNSNTLTIATNAAANRLVPVRGTATGVGTLTTVLPFGTLTGRGSVSTLGFSVTNYGVPGTVTVGTETGATTFAVVANTCLDGVTAGNSCSIEVRYTPVQANVPQTAYLKLIPSTGPTQVITMTGELVP
jgi:hypothetical protein